MSFAEWHSSESLCDTIGRIGGMLFPGGGCLWIFGRP